jgi:hypothetical protein
VTLRARLYWRQRPLAGLNESGGSAEDHLLHPGNTLAPGFVSENNAQVK